MIFDLIPLGGSVVSFNEFCNILTGNVLTGIEVNHNLKLGLTTVSIGSFSFSCLLSFLWFCFVVSLCCDDALLFLSLLSLSGGLFLLFVLLLLSFFDDFFFLSFPLSSFSGVKSIGLSV